MATYSEHIEGKTSEEILGNDRCINEVGTGEYLRVAANVRSNQELIAHLKQDSINSGCLGIFGGTVKLACDLP